PCLLKIYSHMVTFWGNYEGISQDQAGFCKVATLQDIKDNDYVLTPGRYVGAAEQEEDGVAFETKMRELSKTLFEQMKQAEELDRAIRQNLEALGYGI
uniref:N-6 DNA methylase n=1 Tax=Escherichia coli TaxID=562 RepID=UPI002FE040DC